MHFNISTQTHGEVATIVVGGVVCGNGRGTVLWEELYALLRARVPAIVLDLIETETLDHHALRHVRAASELASFRGCELTVMNASTPVGAALAVAGLGPCLRSNAPVMKEAVEPPAGTIECEVR